MIEHPVIIQGDYVGTDPAVTPAYACSDCGEISYKCYCGEDCPTCDKKLYDCIAKSDTGYCINDLT